MPWGGGGCLTMEYINLIFAGCYLWRLAITTLDKHSCIFIIIFAIFLLNDDLDIIFQSSLLFYPGKEYISWLEIETLSCLTSKIWGFEFDLRPSKVRSEIFLLFESPCHNFLSIFYWHFLEMFFRRSTSKSSIDTFYLVPLSKYSTSKFFGFDLDLLPLKVIWGQNNSYCLKAHIWLPIWPSKFRSEIFLLFESPCHNFLSNFYWHFLEMFFRRSTSKSSIDTFYLVPLSKYSTSKFFGFDLDLLPLKVIWGQNNTVWKHIYDFIFDFMDNISLSRTVFEIFDFTVFRVWPLTSKGHLRSKKCIPLESPYTTSYLTFIDTFSLSRTVFKIFDFKVFRCWPWPLSSDGHLGSKFCIPFESPYMYPIVTSMDSPYFVPFLRYSTSKFLGFDLDLWHLKVF